MPLKIVRAADPIEVRRITVVLYGSPGASKTSTAFSAESPILLDFDNGVHRALNRKDSVPIESWADVANITADDLSPYKTVIVDTAGRALDFLANQIMADEPKMKNKSGGLTLPGFGALKARFTSWLNSLTTQGKDVILIVHGKEESKGDEVLERLDVTGASKDEIYKVADAMGRIKIEGGKRMLLFSPTDTAFGKNPGQLPPLEVPHPDMNPKFLGEVIQKIKDKLNQESVEQGEERKRMEGYRETFEALETAEDFTKAVSVAKAADKKVAALLHSIASARKLKWDKEANAYVGAE